MSGFQVFFCKNSTEKIHHIIKSSAYPPPKKTFRLRKNEHSGQLTLQILPSFPRMYPGPEKIPGSLIKSAPKLLTNQQFEKLTH